MESLEIKEKKLEALLRELAPVIVAYSGGVDSSYLAFKAHAVLGNRALAITAESASVPALQRKMAVQIAQQFGFAHRIVKTNELENEAYIVNQSDRCYHCKTELFTILGAIAESAEAAVILDGFNADDTGDFRPGRKAGKEHQVRSPLFEAGLTKPEIRELSRRAGLPTADMPASACLASRFPYGVRITEDSLKLVDQGEEALREMGFTVFRLRHHQELARLEFGAEDLKKALNPDMAAKLASMLKKLGYKYVTLDLEGYRTGSTNEVLSESEMRRFEV